MKQNNSVPTEQTTQDKPSTAHKKITPSEPQTKIKGHIPAPGGCYSWGCKAESNRFNFCNEHYDFFKFGLIKKSGEPVPDFEKKFEHYQEYLHRISVRKVA